MLHFSDCDGSAIFGISSNNFQSGPIIINIGRNQTSSKFWLTWVGVHVSQKLFKKVGVHVLRVLSKLTQTGGGPVLVLGVAFASRSHLARISLPSHSPLTLRWCKISSINHLMHQSATNEEHRTCNTHNELDAYAEQTRKTNSALDQTTLCKTRWIRCPLRPTWRTWQIRRLMH
jgi:hypothetical protein